MKTSKLYECVNFRYCDILFSNSNNDQPSYGDSETVNITISKFGYTPVEIKRNEFIELLNALIRCQKQLQTADLVSSFTERISSTDRHYSEPEMYLTSSKILDDISISFYGYDTSTLVEKKPLELYHFRFDKDDDVFGLCSKFLKSINLSSFYTVGLTRM